MWKPITIKPGDQSLCGYELKVKEIEAPIKYWTVLNVGVSKVFMRDRTGYEDAFPICEQDWLIWEPPPTKNLVAPALVREVYHVQSNQTVQVALGHTLFSSEKEARRYHRDHFISWPALPNKDGFYEVEE